jgi:hypothetical protein
MKHKILFLADKRKNIIKVDTVQWFDEVMFFLPNWPGCIKEALYFILRHFCISYYDYKPKLAESKMPIERALKNCHWSLVIGRNFEELSLVIGECFEGRSLVIGH